MAHFIQEQEDTFAIRYEDAYNQVGNKTGHAKEMRKIIPEISRKDGKWKLEIKRIDESYGYVYEDAIFFDSLLDLLESLGLDLEIVANRMDRWRVMKEFK